MKLIENGIPYEFKRRKYSAGDGITIVDDTISVDSPVQGVYTHAEYESLPEEKRNKGFYAIPDTGASVAGLSNIYSTEETIIGRWIDGRPIYRRTVIGKTPASTNAWKTLIDLDGYNVNEIVNFIGKTDCGDKYKRFFPSYHIYLRFNTSVIEIDVANALFSDKDFVASIEYTKTTDEPTIELPQSLMTLELSNDDYPIQDNDTTEEVLGSEID